MKSGVCFVHRAKLVLGYSEIEISRKGSGYNFIHAADMLYCAENHVRSKSEALLGLQKAKNAKIGTAGFKFCVHHLGSITQEICCYLPAAVQQNLKMTCLLAVMKTGESGITIFRLLTKAGRWVWVQANARLIIKNGKPEFIVAQQRALT